MNRLGGCTDSFESARIRTDQLINMEQEDGDDNEVMSLAAEAYSLYERASICRTPLSANAGFAMAAFHCAGYVPGGIDIKTGASLINRAGEIPGASYSRVFNAILSCRQADFEAIVSR